MKFTVEQWEISELRNAASHLSLNPRYQRGEAWKEEKQGLLIDTILMGYDIPKIYLAKNNSSALSKFDVVDGQQRLRSILRFLGDQLDEKGKPLNLKKRWGLEWSAIDIFDFESLTERQKNKFLSYNVSVTIVENATNDQLRRLFLRLQMGSSLNQAELRNALASQTGDHINAIVDNHHFFKIAAIPIGRYKRQDYLAQALVASRNKSADLIADVDADAARRFYLGDDESATFWSRVHSVLDLMESISEQCPRCFANKWTFVDFFCYFWIKRPRLGATEKAHLASKIKALEYKRLQVKNAPESLVGKRGDEAKLLLGYVDAFYKDGGLGRNLEKRFSYLESIHHELFEV